MDYSKLLKEIRKKLNISQTELAEWLDVDYSTVSRIERKVFNPSFNLISKIESFAKRNEIIEEKTHDLEIQYKHDKNIIDDIENIISEARSLANKSINYLLIERNWLIGKRIGEEILTSRQKDYGRLLILNLSNELTRKYGKGFDRRNLYYYLDFYNKFPNILNSLGSQSFLTWTHYRILLQINDEKERKWYANEANTEAWSVRTLQRNISSQYYRRLLSSNKKDDVYDEMLILNNIKRQEAFDFIKDPMILEFLGIEEDNSYKESDLESAIISHINKFLLELGKGYAFVARQQRVHTEKEDYFIDLVFYNYLLKCFVLVDLKTSKISYQDVGQMDMYIKMYDEFKKGSEDNPTLGIILTSDTDEDVARYSVLNGNEQLFASKYKLYLPSNDELKTEIERQKNLFLSRENN